MNTNPYSYDESLAIIDLCSSLEFHSRHEPEAKHIRVLGISLTTKIMEMNHLQRILMVKEITEFL